MGEAVDIETRITAQREVADLLVEQVRRKRKTGEMMPFCLGRNALVARTNRGSSFFTNK